MYYFESVHIFESLSTLANRSAFSRRSRACMHVQDAPRYPRSMRRVAGYWYRCTRKLGNARRYTRVPLTCAMHPALSRGQLLEKVVDSYIRKKPCLHCARTERISQWCNKHDKYDKGKDIFKSRLLYDRYIYYLTILLSSFKNATSKYWL